MDDKIDQALVNVLAMVRSNVRADEATAFTQAALNLAHVRVVLAGLDKDRVSRKGGDMR